MKRIFQILILIIFGNSFLFAQTSIMKDTIALESVIVKSPLVRKKIIKTESKGIPAYNGLRYLKKVVCLQKDLPKGVIKSVTFYFNCGLINILHKQLNIKYKDVKIGLILYKVSDDGFPGETISEREIDFVVSADHRGAFVVNLERLNLVSEDMFIGVELLTEMPNNENNIYIRFDESKQARSYVVYQNLSRNLNGKWKSSSNYNFKSEIKIEQLR